MIQAPTLEAYMRRSSPTSVCLSTDTSSNIRSNALAMRAIEKMQRKVNVKKSLETQIHINKVFNAVDKDKSGFIDLDEFAAMSENKGLSIQELKRRFEEIDVDKSGTIDKLEFAKFLEEESLRSHDRAERDKTMFLQETSEVGEEIGAMNGKIEVQCVAIREIQEKKLPKKRHVLKTASEKLIDLQKEKESLEAQQVRIEAKAMEAQARLQKALVDQEKLGLRSSSLRADGAAGVARSGILRRADGAAGVQRVPVLVKKTSSF